MASDNPAGRLHALLERFSAVPQGTSIVAAWAEVLGVPQDEVHLHIGRVGELMQEVSRRAAATQDDAWVDMPGYLARLANCVFPTSVPFGAAASEVPPDPEAMRLLATLRFGLRDQGVGHLPEDEQAAALIDTVNALRDEVHDSALPPKPKELLLNRLQQVLDALLHLDVGGPDAVEQAAEALSLITIIIEQQQPAHATLFGRIRQLATDAMTVVGIVVALGGPTPEEAIKALGGALSEPAAISQPVEPETVLPATPSAGEEVVDAEVVDDAPSARLDAGPSSDDGSD